MAVFAEYDDLDALGLAALVREGEITPAELLAAALERTDARNPEVNAIVRRMDEHARRQIDEGLPDGPFTGVPYLIKDLASHVAGVPTTRGSAYWEGHVPTEDSEHVKRLKRAGLVQFGRTNTCELGLSLTCEPRYWGPCRNPWDTSRISGGSSGGAGSAVAAGIGLGALFEGESGQDARFVSVRFRALPRASGVYAVALRDSLGIPAVKAFFDHVAAVGRR